MKIFYPLGVFLTWLFFTATGNAEEPLRVNQIWKGDLELILPEEGGFKSNRDKFPLMIKLANIDNSPQDEIIYIPGRRQSEGYEGTPAVYTWDGNTFHRPSIYASRLSQVYDFDVYSSGIWIGQGKDLVWIGLFNRTWEITHFAPGSYNLPIRSVNVLNDPSGHLLLVGFLSSVEISPAGTSRRYQFVVFRLKDNSILKVAEVGNVIATCCGSRDPSIVVTDFNQDGVDEVAVYTPSGDSGYFWLLQRDPSWRFVKFAEGPYHYLMGAGDVDRNGNIELLAGGFYYQGHNSPWCFEWRQGTFVFDRPITIPGNDGVGPYLLGNLIGSSVPELLYYRDNSVTVYGFE